MTSSLYSTPTITAAQAEQVGKRPDALREDDPPLLRFAESTVEDRNESLRQGRFIHLPVTMVYIRARGDNKTEVAEIVKGWKIETKEVETEKTRKVYRHERDPDTGELREVEKEITETVMEPYQYRIEVFPWLEKLAERLHHGKITKHYHDHCVRAYENYKNNHEAPIDGTPLNGWNQINQAMQKNAIDLGINSIERAAEMNDETMDALGMGARQMKKLAIAYVKSSDTAVNASTVVSLQEEVQRQSDELSAYKQKIAELEAGAAAEAQVEAQNTRKKPGPKPRARKLDNGLTGDDSIAN